MPTDRELEGLRQQGMVPDAEVRIQQEIRKEQIREREQEGLRQQGMVSDEETVAYTPVIEPKVVYPTKGAGGEVLKATDFIAPTRGAGGEYLTPEMFKPTSPVIKEPASRAAARAAQSRTRAERLDTARQRVKNLTTSISPVLRNVSDPYFEIARDKELSAIEKAKGIGLAAADMFVPGVWARHWGEMNTQDKVINIALDLLVLAPLAGPAITRSIKAAIKGSAARGIDKALERDFGKVLTTLEVGVETKNVGFVKLAGKDMQILAKKIKTQGVKDGGSKALEMRGAFFEQNAKEVVNMVKATDRALSPGERKILTSQLMKNKKTLEALKKEYALIEKKPGKGLSPKGEGPLKPGGNLVVNSGTGRRLATIPTEAFGRMTKEQIARLYLVGVADLTAAVSKALPEVQKVIREWEQQRVKPTPEVVLAPNTIPGTKPTPKVVPAATPASKPTPAVQPTPAAKTSPEVRPSPAPKTTPAVQPTPAPKTSPAPKPSPLIRPSPVPKPIHSVKPEPLKIPKPKRLLRIPPAGTESNEKKREFINAQPGIIARRRGQLGGKDVWHVRYAPYREQDRLIILGDAPAGAIAYKGKGSTAKSAILLRGKPPTSVIRVDTGAVDDLIIPTKRGITVRSVKDLSVRRKPPQVPKPKSPSVKVGQMYYTKIGRSKLISRKPLG